MSVIAPASSDKPWWTYFGFMCLIILLVGLAFDFLLAEPMVNGGASLWKQYDWLYWCFCFSDELQWL
jgi:hypothetical protein